jgi:hypothetical protein
MKKIFELTVGIATIVVLMLSLQSTAKAQVYGDFDTIRIVEANFQTLEDGIEIPSIAFGLPPTWLQDLDDGYSYPNGIDIGFPFEFGGEIFTRLWVCVNGFVTFSPPPQTPAKDPTALFSDNSSYPRNVLAPFWGDHVYRLDVERFNGYKPTKIFYKSDPDNGVFIVEWRYLNINDASIKSSIATFQLRLYKSQDPYSAQGNIEFAYGQIGGNEYTNDTRVITRNASVGIKGDFSPADFLNGLEYGKSPEVARTSTRLTNEWTPSGATNYRILFTALARYNVEEFWGDGDVDMSKGYLRKHYNMPQSRYVTVNDARLIMKSIAINVPLDSVRRRAAYHGDVNHNGRYYYDQYGNRKEVKWRTKYYGDSLPAEVGSLKQIFYQVTAYDAALILHYISARIPQLPWLYDTTLQNGKIGAIEVADNIRFGKPESVAGGFKIPVYLNGEVNGPVSIVMDLNNEVNVSGVNEDLEWSAFKNRVVVAGTGKFSAESPLFYLEVGRNNSILVAEKVIFNDEEKNKSAVVLSVVDASGVYAISLNQNPVVNENARINLTIGSAGSYIVEIFDATGNVVKRFEPISSENANEFSLNWNLTDNSGNVLPNGAYFVRMSGNGASVVEKLIISR